jgi:hypothetical protein
LPELFGPALILRNPFDKDGHSASKVASEHVYQRWKAGSFNAPVTPMTPTGSSLATGIIWTAAN